MQLLKIKRYISNLEHSVFISQFFCNLYFYTDFKICLRNCQFGCRCWKTVMSRVTKSLVDQGTAKPVLLHRSCTLNSHKIMRINNMQKLCYQGSKNLQKAFRKRWPCLVLQIRVRPVADAIQPKEIVAVFVVSVPLIFFLQRRQKCQFQYFHFIMNRMNVRPLQL